MELPIALSVGVLFAGAVYSLLRPNLLRLVIGFNLLSNAVNLTMIAVGGFTLGSAAPFVSDPGVVGGLMDTFRAMGQQPRALILRMRLVPMIDASGATALEGLVDEARRAGIEVILSGVQPQPQEMLR